MLQGEPSRACWALSRTPSREEIDGRWASRDAPSATAGLHGHTVRLRPRESQICDGGVSPLSGLAGSRVAQGFEAHGARVHHHQPPDQALAEPTISRIAQRHHQAQNYPPAPITPAGAGRCPAAAVQTGRQVGLNSRRARSCARIVVSDPSNIPSAAVIGACRQNRHRTDGAFRKLSEPSSARS